MEKEKINRQMFRGLNINIFTVFLLLIILGIYYFFNHALTESKAELSDMTSELDTYKSTVFKEDLTATFQGNSYSFQYPADLYAEVDPQDKSWVNIYLDKNYAIQTDNCKKDINSTTAPMCGYGWLVFSMYVTDKPNDSFGYLIQNKHKSEVVDNQNRKWDVYYDLLPMTGGYLTHVAGAYILNDNGKSIGLTINFPDYSKYRINKIFIVDFLSTVKL